MEDRCKRPNSFDFAAGALAGKSEDVANVLLGTAFRAGMIALGLLAVGDRKRILVKSLAAASVVEGFVFLHAARERSCRLGSKS